MFDELKNIDGLDGYLIRIATILKFANLQHDLLEVGEALFLVTKGVID